MREIDENRPILEALGIVETQEAVEHDVKPATSAFDGLPADDIRRRLEDIKKRIVLLEAVYTKSLSRDISNEIDAWRVRFKELSDILIDRDPESLYEVVRGREDFFLSSEKPTAKPQIPISVQRMAELTWQVQQEPTRKPPKSNPLDFGMGTFLS